jgi:hypothetical protein
MSSMVAYNPGCNPWREDKVLAALLFLLGWFHLFHLYNMSCKTFVI